MRQRRNGQSSGQIGSRTIHSEPNSAAAPPRQTTIAAPALQGTGDAQQGPRARPLRSVLLGTATAGLMLFGYGRSVYAQVSPPTPPCNQISGGGSTVTCTGDVSNGILVDGDTLPYTTLNVNTIAGDITPGSRTNGIYFYNSNGNGITVDSDTGNFIIDTVTNGG